MLLWPPNMTFYWFTWSQLATSLFSFFVSLGLIWIFWTVFRLAQTYHNNKNYLRWPYFNFQSCIWQLMKNHLLELQWGPLLISTYIENLKFYTSIQYHFFLFQCMYIKIRINHWSYIWYMSFKYWMFFQQWNSRWKLCFRLWCLLYL